MAELLIGLLIVVIFAFLIRYIINEKSEGNWDSPILPQEAEQEQPAVPGEPVNPETAGNGAAGAAENIETPQVEP